MNVWVYETQKNFLMALLGKSLYEAATVASILPYTTFFSIARIPLFLNFRFSQLILITFSNESHLIVLRLLLTLIQWLDTNGELLITLN